MAHHGINACLFHGLYMLDEVVAAFFDPADILTFVFLGHRSPGTGIGAPPWHFRALIVATILLHSA